MINVYLGKHMTCDQDWKISIAHGLVDLVDQYKIGIFWSQLEVTCFQVQFKRTFTPLGTENRASKSQAGRGGG